MAVEIEPLLQKLTAIAPLFGRAKDDIEAMVSRGRSGDYKGVMQNARLVLETLLRSMVTEELKQTPGKAMLDELVSKFRQQSNAGVIPTNILAHMGTVQAWGNLSTHDHAGSLTDAAVTVGQDEVVASLNSVVAILTWYAGRKNLTPSAGSGAVPTPATRSKLPLVAGLALALVAGGAAFVFLRPPAADAASATPPFQALDAVYSAWNEPVPPARCRNEKEGALLARSATNLDALKLIEQPSPEASYLLARALFAVHQTSTDALTRALSCEGFASAEHLAAQIAITRSDLAEARTHLERARASAPGFLDARSKLAGVLLAQHQVDDALREADALVQAAPDFHPGFLVRFSGRLLKGDREGAMKDLCMAGKLGSTQARSKLEELHASCE